MKTLRLQTHYAADEATRILMMLDELRDAIWNQYRDEIIEYCHQQQLQTIEHRQYSFDFEDDPIPF